MIRHDWKWYVAMEEKFKKLNEEREEVRKNREDLFIRNLNLEQIRDELDCEIWNAEEFYRMERALKEFAAWASRVLNEKINFPHCWFKSKDRETLWKYTLKVYRKLIKSKAKDLSVLEMRKHLDDLLGYDSEFYSEGYAWNSEEKRWI